MFRTISIIQGFRFFFPILVNIYIYTHIGRWDPSLTTKYNDSYIPYTCGLKAILYILTDPAFWLQATTRCEFSICDIRPALKVSDFRQFRSSKVLHYGCKIAYNSCLCHLLLCAKHTRRRCKNNQKQAWLLLTELGRDQSPPEDPTHGCIITAERSTLMERDCTGR